MNLSSIVSLLVETFLPALRQKYLFANFEQSHLNRKYNNYIPPYLQNRPREVILHCLDRKASSARYTENDITVVDDKTGVFEVTNSKGYSYTVKVSVPSCSCPDWAEHHYPCKHFFAVFHHHSTWDWNALPQAYLSSPRLSLDTQALNQYFNHDDNMFDTTQGENNVQEVGDAVPKCKVYTLTKTLT